MTLLFRRTSSVLAGMTVASTAIVSMPANADDNPSPQSNSDQALEQGHPYPQLADLTPADPDVEAPLIEDVNLLTSQEAQDIREQMLREMNNLYLEIYGPLEQNADLSNLDREAYWEDADIAVYLTHETTTNGEILWGYTAAPVGTVVLSDGTAQVTNERAAHPISEPYHGDPIMPQAPSGSPIWDPNDWSDVQVSPLVSRWDIDNYHCPDGYFTVVASSRFLDRTLDHAEEDPQRHVGMSYGTSVSLDNDEGCLIGGVAQFRQQIYSVEGDRAGETYVWMDQDPSSSWNENCHDKQINVSVAVAGWGGGISQSFQSCDEYVVEGAYAAVTSPYGLIGGSVATSSFPPDREAVQLGIMRMPQGAKHGWRIHFNHSIWSIET